MRRTDILPGTMTARPLRPVAEIVAEMRRQRRNPPPPPDITIELAGTVPLFWGVCGTELYKHLPLLLAQSNPEMTKPLGLAGRFTVKGLNECCSHYEFPFDVSPEMSPFHLMDAAAVQYVLNHGAALLDPEVGRYVGHVYFESMEIDLNMSVITLGMGS